MNPRAAITASDHLGDVQHLLTAPRHVVRSTATIDETAARLLRDPSSSTAYVVNLNGRLLGIVPFARLQRALHARVGVRATGVGGLVEGLRDARRLTAEDVMAGIEAPTAAVSIRAALLAMQRAQAADLPVVDGRGKLWLELTHAGHARLLALLLEGAEARLAQRPHARPEPRRFEHDGVV